MKILSFGWTWPALRYGPKRVTRRHWNARYAEMFNAGDLVQAWDRSPRIGGKRIGTIELTDDAYLQPTAEMQDSEYELEGFKFIFEHPEYVPRRLFDKPCTRDDFSFDGFCRWRDSGQMMWVVRFKVVEMGV